MSSHPTHTTPQDDPTKPPADPHGDRAVLHDLIGMGAGLARLLHAQANHQAEAARAAVPPPPTPAMPYEPPATTLVTLTNAFDRISRAVRRCIALAERLAHPPAPARDPAHHRAAARKHILRAVEDTIHRAANEGDRAECLRAELRDRLDDPDLDWDLATRPIPDIIAEITRDLGLATPPGGARPWPRRTPADIQDLHARAAAPSSAATGYQHEASPAGHVGPHVEGPHAKGDASGESPGAPEADRRPTEPPRAAKGSQPGPTRGPTQGAPQRPSPQRPPADPWHAEPTQITPTAAFRPSTATSGPQVSTAQPTPAILFHPTRLRGHWRPPPGT